MCPHCRRNAPILYRGLVSYCTACGRERLPFTGTSLNLAGKPSKLGGCLAGVVGWLVLAGGTVLSLLVGLLFQFAWPDSYAGIVAAIPVAATTLVIGIMLLMGGRKLEKSGEETQERTRDKALFAYASTHAGIVHPREAALALDMPHAEIDARLTELAKTYSDEVSVEFDDRGHIFYEFKALRPAKPDDFEGRLRVAEAENAGKRVKIDEGDAEAEAEAELDAEEARARR